MQIKSILTPLDNSKHCTDRVNYALMVAEQQKARLVGVAPLEIDVSLMSGEFISATPNWREELQKNADLQAHKVTAAFIDQCSEAEFRSMYTLTSEGSSTDAVAENSLVSDLIVLTQYLESAGSDPRDKGLVEHTILWSNKPVLVLPAMGTYEKLPGKVIVGWANTSECARAVTAAIPLLQHADTVEIVHVCSNVKSTCKEKASLLEYLALHDVDATFAAKQSTIDPANFLLSYACDNGAEMLVMGGYGHSRYQEWVLGGSTRTILETMTLPVLMAH